MASDEEIHDLPFGASMFLQVACQRIFSKIEVVVIALLVIALDRSIYLQTLTSHLVQPPPLYSARDKEIRFELVQFHVLD